MVLCNSIAAKEETKQENSGTIGSSCFEKSYAEMVYWSTT